MCVGKAGIMHKVATFMNGISKQSNSFTIIKTFESFEIQYVQIIASQLFIFQWISSFEHMLY